MREGPQLSLFKKCNWADRISSCAPPSARGAAEISPGRKPGETIRKKTKRRRCDTSSRRRTAITLRQNSDGELRLDFCFGKNRRQDRRRSDKYELTTEHTNNPNTAKPRNITITGLPSKHPFTVQAAGQLPRVRFQPLNSSSGQSL